MKTYQKFFASLIGVLIAAVGLATGSDLGLPEGTLEMFGSAIASVAVWFFPNFDEKGEHVADKVDRVLDSVREIVRKLPDR